MATLYCAKCGYNLTGLRENRCPECGLEFDPQILAREGWLSPTRPISSLLLLLIAPALATCGSILAVFANGSSDVIMGFLWLLGIGSAGLALAFSIIAGRRFARRIVKRPKLSGPSTGSVMMTVLLAGVFLFAQLCLAFAGFFGACVCYLQYHPI